MRHYTTNLRDKARDLRHTQTDVERALWRLLRSREMAGFKFRRQHPLCGYIVDFVCLEKRLVVELDGGQHQEQAEYDRARTRKLEAAGFCVLRFWNNDLIENRQGVLESILAALVATSAHLRCAPCLARQSRCAGERLAVRNPRSAPGPLPVERGEGEKHEAA